MRTCFQAHGGPDLSWERVMIELTELRVFSDTEFELGKCRGYLLLGAEEETAELFFCTPWTTEEEAERLLNARYATLVAGSPAYGADRVEGLAELDNLRALCAERNAALDALAENAAYPEVVGAEVAVSGHDRAVTYKAGETVRAHEWCEDWTQECAGGIHFFLTRIEAENHTL